MLIFGTITMLLRLGELTCQLILLHLINFIIGILRFGIILMTPRRTRFLFRDTLRR